MQKKTLFIYIYIHIFIYIYIHNSLNSFWIKKFIPAVIRLIVCGPYQVRCMLKCSVLLARVAGVLLQVQRCFLTRLASMCLIG